MTDQKRASLKKAFDLFLKAIEKAAAEAKNLEVTANKNGDISIKFRKEI